MCPDRSDPAQPYCMRVDDCSVIGREVFVTTSFVNFDALALRRRVAMQDMHAKGISVETIAAHFQTTERGVRYNVALPRPQLRRVKQSQEWRDWAACNEGDTHLFFPDARGVAASNRIRQAQKICAGCPVKEQCLQAAFDNYETDGVWGGEDMSKYYYRYADATGEVFVRIGGSGAPLKKVG